MAPRKTPTKRAAPGKRPAAGKTAKKAAPKKAAAKGAAKKPATKKPAFGRPGTAGKGEGNEAVKAWLAGVKPEHRSIAERLDKLIEEVVPDVRRAVKWSMPMYGREGKGYFAHVGAFKSYVALGFFLGTELTPPPPEGKGEGMRRVNIHDIGEFDEARFRSWIQQAASRQGWSKV